MNRLVTWYRVHLEARWRLWRMRRDQGVGERMRSERVFEWSLRRAYAEGKAVRRGRSLAERVVGLLSALVIVLPLLCAACAWSDAELKRHAAQVGFWGQFFGEQGVVASTAITGVMVAAVQVYRSVTGPKRYAKYAKQAEQKKALGVPTDPKA